MFSPTNATSPRAFFEQQLFKNNVTSPRSALEQQPAKSKTPSPRSFFEEQPAKKDSLIIQQKLAKGKFTVYQAFCPSHNAYYALKAFPKDIFGTLQYQKEMIISKLNHPNIIKHIPIQCNSTQFYSLVTEYAPNGSLFAPVLKGILNHEILARTYFRQLIEGIEYMHSQGVAHLDIKLENLMFGSDFQLKIIDFDQAQPLRDRQATSGGTLCFRAPELAKGICKDLAAADVYSAGVVLFTFKAREYPFLETDTQSKKEVFYYYTFVKNNDVFWQMKSEVQGKKTEFGPEFIELMNGMLEPEPSRRIKIADVKKSKWYNGPVLTPEALRAEMTLKYEAMMKKSINKETLKK